MRLAGHRGPRRFTNSKRCEPRWLRFRISTLMWLLHTQADCVTVTGRSGQDRKRKKSRGACRQLAGTKHGTSCSRRVYQRPPNAATASPAEQTKPRLLLGFFSLSSRSISFIFLFSAFLISDIRPRLGIHKFDHFLVITRYKRHQLFCTRTNKSLLFPRLRL